ncbi:MAG: hypothetical protein ACK5M7_08905 [Draconibacterium sp.]
MNKDQIIKNNPEGIKRLKQLWTDFQRFKVENREKWKLYSITRHSCAIEGAELSEFRTYLLLERKLVVQANKNGKLVFIDYDEYKNSEI